MKSTYAEFEGTITLKGHERDVLISYAYHDGYVEVVDAYTHAVKKSALLKKRVEIDLIGFLERQAEIDFDRRCDTSRDEAADNRRKAAS